MSPQLNFHAKQLFLEQTLLNIKGKKPNHLLKSLLINNKFLNIANKFKIYNAYINTRPHGHGSLSFGNSARNQNHCGGASFECICQILKLTKPHFVKIYYNTDCKNFDLDKVLTLKDASQNRIFLEIWGDDSLSALKRVWNRVDELKSSASVLAEIEDVPKRLFDKLSVYNIENNNELRSVLKHSAKQMKLSFESQFDSTSVGNVQTYENESQQLICEFNNIKTVDRISPILRTVFNACKQMEKLEILYTNRFQMNIPDLTALVNSISNWHKLFVETIQVVRQLSPNLFLAVKTDLNIRWVDLKFDLPENWKQELKKNDGLENTLFEETKQKDEIEVNIVSEVVDDSHSVFVIN
ncbi:hypothetical protein M3Y97_01068200 [Aphelenchoides bicaudatus]|nr:hypothetical protein M3Y97_01068200 [Aphelenchoides bicaudatus]